MSSKLKLLPVAFGGVCLSAAIVYFGDLRLKWLVVFVLLTSVPIFVTTVGSLRNAFMVLLIFSISMQMSFNPVYSDYSSTHLGLRISLTTLVLLPLYILWLFELLHGVRSVRFFPFVTVPLGIIVLWSGLSFFVAEKPYYVSYQFLPAIESFLVYFYAANYLKSQEDTRFIMKWVFIAVAFEALVAIGQYLAPGAFNLKYMGWHEESLKLYYAGRTISRPSGFLGHANNLASFLATWLPLLFIYIIGFDEKLHKRTLHIIFFALGIVALLLTFSRGGWLTFAFAIFSILILLSKRDIRRKFPKIIPRIFCLSLIGLIMILPFSSDIRHRLTKDDYRAGKSRIVLAKKALQIIKEKPITGVGLGYYSDFKLIPPHNIYLQTATELGLVALILLIWVFWIFIRQGLVALQLPDKRNVLFAIGLFAGLTGAYLNGMFELGTIGYSQFLRLLFMGGLLVALGQYQKQNSALSLSEAN